MHARPPRPPERRRAPGLSYAPGWLRPADRAELLAALATLRPLWEQRYSPVRGAPPGETQRGLLRPVYWLGNWQFACLGYYEPPRQTADCAVTAEPYPPVLVRLVREMEARIRKIVPASDIPAGWALNTCLINLYGNRVGADGREEDVARVGAHRDFEPGPVASLSLGERALFQFLRRGRDATVEQTTWLEDGSLQVFGGWWKDALLHRVQRVEDKRHLDLEPRVPGFRTRRINLTLRYVPPAHLVRFQALGPEAKADVHSYVETLASASPFWARELSR